MGRPKYQCDYRRDALKLADEMGVRPAAKKLEISHETLYRWIRDPNALKPHTPKDPHPEKSTINELRLEIRELKELVRVLKLALGFYQDHLQCGKDEDHIFQ